MPTDAALKKGTAELLVLAQLEDGDRHGYEIGQRIATRGGGGISFQPASLYPVLYRLERRGLITGRWVEKANQRRRRYYRLTADGAPRARRAAQPMAHVHAGHSTGRGCRICVTSETFVRAHVAPLALRAAARAEDRRGMGGATRRDLRRAARRRPLRRRGVERHRAAGAQWNAAERSAARRCSGSRVAGDGRHARSAPLRSRRVAYGAYGRLREVLATGLARDLHGSVRAARQEPWLQRHRRADAGDLPRRQRRDLYSRP